MDTLRITPRNRRSISAATVAVAVDTHPKHLPPIALGDQAADAVFGLRNAKMKCGDHARDAHIKIATKTREATGQQENDAAATRRTKEMRCLLKGHLFDGAHTFALWTTTFLLWRTALVLRWKMLVFWGTSVVLRGTTVVLWTTTFAQWTTTVVLRRKIKVV